MTRPILRSVVAVALALAAGPVLAQTDTRLVEAVKRGDRNAAAVLARAGGVNGIEADGTTALHWAVRNGDADTARLLLERGANASARNRYGVTPLSLAATNGDAALIRRLLVAGADPNTTVTEGQTVLMVAARTGRPEAIEALVEAGADVNARESWMGETALMWAAADNHADAVRALVKHGAQIDARSATVAYPPQKPKDPSNYVTSFVPKGQWTPLMYAAREGAAEAAMALADLGADVNVQDPEGVTPLLEAILNAHFDLAAQLLKRGANPNLADKAGMAPLYAAIDMNTPPWERSRPDAKITTELDCLGLMKVLLDHGADVNARIKSRLLSRYHAGGAPGMIEGTTPLIRAAKYANRDMVELLVSRGADVTLAQTDGTTALMFAAGVKYSITQQGDPPNHGTLDDAVAIVKLLHEKGADLNTANTRGETALYGAAFAGRNKVIRYLADSGGRLDVRTKQGLTVLDGALNTGVAEDGTGSRVGGKPGPETVALVRDLMLAAGLQPSALNDATFKVQPGPARETPKPTTGR
jgi:ankyrin repeat protein